MNELKWIEWNEVKWVICRIWLDEPYGNGPMVDWECPYESDLSESENESPYQNEWIQWEMN